MKRLENYKQLIPLLYYGLILILINNIIVFGKVRLLIFGIAVLIGLLFFLLYKYRFSVFHKMLLMTGILVLIQVYFYYSHLESEYYYFFLVIIPALCFFVLEELIIFPVISIVILSIIFSAELAGTSHNHIFNLVLIGIFMIIIALLITIQKVINQKSQMKIVELENTLNYDSLTGLANKEKLLKIINDYIRSGQQFTFLLIDLDRFRMINSTYGRHFGDFAIQTTAQRISKFIKKENISRIDGDEFAFIINDIKSGDAVLKIVENIIQEIKKPVCNGNVEISLSASAGIVYSTEICETAEDFFKAAEMSMYQAKLKGRNVYELYDNNLEILTLRQLQLENDLKSATRNHEFKLFFQPIVSLLTNETCGFEALIRWFHPKYGMIPPVEFISIAEQTGIIIEIGEWVFKEVCAEMEKLNNTYNISFNLSPVQLKYPQLIHRFKEIYSAHRIPNNTINVEITENAIIDDTGNAKTVLEEFKEIGLNIHLDDFGTGYSSLSYLCNYPIDVVKIDRSFVQSLDQSEKNFNLVKSIIYMAYSLEMSVVGEGIENEVQLITLKELGCECGQGYYFSKPVSEEDLFRLYKNNNCNHEKES